MYALADCNNFFVSCERFFDPRLNGKPVVVLSNNDGCAISRSNEAKALGIPMGCPAFKIKNYPNAEQVIMLSARHVLYNDLSARIMRILGEIAIDLEVYSVDEAFFKLPFDDEKRNHELLAQVVKKIHQWVGIPVSIGFASTRTLAKIASHVAKKHKASPNRVKGLVNQAEIDQLLRTTPIDDIWGIGRRLNAKLLSSGIHFASDFVSLPKSFLQRIGNINLVRTQQELLGNDCISINPVTIAHKSIMNSRTFGHVLNNKRDISDAVISFAQSCASQLRREQSAASIVTVFLRGDHFRDDLPFYSNSCTLRMQSHTSSSILIARHALIALNSIFRQGYYYRKAAVMLSDIIPLNQLQPNIFNAQLQAKHSKLMDAVDTINKRYSTNQVVLAPTLTNAKWAPRQNHLSRHSKSLRFYSGMSPYHPANTTHHMSHHENQDEIIADDVNDLE